MNILIVSATQFEVKPLLNFLGIALPSIGMNNANIDFEEKDIKVLITGIGMVNTAFMIGRYTDNSYNLIINVGVCGAFGKDLKLGQLVHVRKDILSELGAEDGDDFLTYDKLNLGGDHTFSNNLKKSYKNIDQLKTVTGITVNTIHGNESSICKVKKIYDPGVESMEGAAFYASCVGVGADYTQVRAISNYVEKRDKSKWQMPLAIKNLNDFMIELINDL
jgi:futalosine hydrolase